MKKNAYELQSSVNGKVRIDVIPGHFATKHSHINYCVDMTRVKSEMGMAKETARLFAEHFSNTPVETIVSLERMKMVGAFLAAELTHSGVNTNEDIAVITPEITDNKMIMRDNFLPYIQGKHVLLLTASASTGLTVAAAVEGIRYYGGVPVGAAIVFGTKFHSEDFPVVRLFDDSAIEGYSFFTPQECPLCAKGDKLEALINSYGYSKIIK